MGKQWYMTEIGQGWAEIIQGILKYVEPQPRPISEYREWFQPTQDLFQKYLKREIWNHLKHFEIGWGVAETYFKMLRMISNLLSKILFILHIFLIIAMCYIEYIAWKYQQYNPVFRVVHIALLRWRGKKLFK